MIGEKSPCHSLTPERRSRTRVSPTKSRYRFSMKPKRYFHRYRNGNGRAFLSRRIESPFAQCFNRFLIEIGSKAVNHLQVVRYPICSHDHADGNRTLNSVVASGRSVFSVRRIDRFRRGGLLLSVFCESEYSHEENQPANAQSFHRFFEKARFDSPAF
jgi:hypothetical protein